MEPDTPYVWTQVYVTPPELLPFQRVVLHIRAGPHDVRTTPIQA